ncbi:hypothetical protein E2C01_013694 [Portunus trituberculatus]|uniref:Uncharacterized protein n=1 Tax=Portunus trituberculatus TaxID=210409 RepID=A0A5B7DI64_PORTR|nr:hypothetical protein [Portunus trituberculatus]
MSRQPHTSDTLAPTRESLGAAEGWVGEEEEETGMGWILSEYLGAYHLSGRGDQSGFENCGTVWWCDVYRDVVLWYRVRVVVVRCGVVWCGVMRCGVV